MTTKPYVKLEHFRDNMLVYKTAYRGETCFTRANKIVEHEQKQGRHGYIILKIYDGHGQVSETRKIEY